jgi:predicted phosphohydrolase
MKLGWLSDIHLDCLEPPAVPEFLEGLSSHEVDAWLISGDIGLAAFIGEYLQLFAKLVPRTAYFTLGNHDFYGGSIARVHEEVGRLAARTPSLVWLTATEPQILSGSLAIVGDDSWSDARLGNAHGTPVELTDFYAIEELCDHTRADLVSTLNRLGDDAAARMAPKLERAAARCDRVVVVMHVPPFREAAWYQGRPSNDDWLPWFSCHAVGEALLRCAREHPAVRFLVLCGHTHGSGIYSPVKNVTVHTAAAEYAAPHVQCVFELDS